MLGRIAAIFLRNSPAQRSLVRRSLGSFSSVWRAAPALCGLAVTGLVYAQSTSSIILSNGVQLKVEANLGQPTGQQSIKVEMNRASGDSFYRIFRDQNGLAVFAYELGVGLSDTGAAVQFTATPVEAEFAAKFPNADGGKPVPTLSEVRALPPLDSGGNSQIGLFELQGVGLSVIDTVSVDLDPSRSEAGASDRIRLSGLKLKINDAVVTANGSDGSVTGRYAMIYIPGKGAFILCAQPVASPGFVKVGSIEGSKLKFTWNNETVEADGDALMLGGSGTGELWVNFDPSYRPLGNWTKTRTPDGLGEGDEFFAAASDSLGWWLP